MEKIRPAKSLEPILPVSLKCPSTCDVEQLADALRLLTETKSTSLPINLWPDLPSQKPARLSLVTKSNPSQTLFKRLLFKRVLTLTSTRIEVYSISRSG